MSGQSNPDSIMNSVGTAHQLLNKPVNVDDFFETLELSRSLYNRIKDPTLQQILSKAHSLPTPKETYFKLSELFQSQNFDLIDVSKLVIQDVAISAKVMQFVNSAAFYRGQRVESIFEAVSILGVETVRSIVRRGRAG